MMAPEVSLHALCAILQLLTVGTARHFSLAADPCFWFAVADPLMPEKVASRGESLRTAATLLHFTHLSNKEYPIP